MTTSTRRTFLKSAVAGSALLAMAGASPVRQALASQDRLVTYPKDYQAGSENKNLEPTNLIDIEKEAKNILPKGGFDYIAGGAGDEWTLHENREAFTRRQIAPRALTNVDTISTQCSLLGIDLPLPVFICPMGGQGLAHVSAEAGMAIGARAAGTLMCLSTVSTLSMEQVAQAADGPKWFQLYLQTDDGINRELVQRAKKAGYRAIVLTVDTTATGNREADTRNHFVFPLPFGNMKTSGGGVHSLNATFATKIGPESIEFVAKESGLPVIVKGIMHPDDAERALAAGAAAIQISNHGGRQLDGGPASFTMLPRIARQVKKRVPIILDSGIRRGQDVFKALACGADAVGLGRPAYYGLALGGGKGVQSVLELLLKELRMVMQLAGTPTIAAIQATQLLRNGPGAPSPEGKHAAEV